MIRYAYAAAAALLACAPAHAVTIYDGSAQAGEKAFLPIPGVQYGTAQRFTLEWTGGELTEPSELVAVSQMRVSFYIFPGSGLFYDELPFGNRRRDLLSGPFAATGPIDRTILSPGLLDVTFSSPFYDLSGCLGGAPAFQTCATNYVNPFLVLNIYYDAPTSYRLTVYDAYSLSVPEPATWAMMIGGFGLVGGAIRRRRSVKVSYA